MNRKIIIGVIVLIALALAGLILVQSYWIKKALAVNQNQFDHLVNHSLLHVVNEIEKNETVTHVLHTIKPSALHMKKLPKGNIQVIVSHNEYYSHSKYGIKNDDYIIYQSQVSNFPDSASKSQRQPVLMDTLYPHYISDREFNDSFVFGIQAPDEEEVRLELSQAMNRKTMQVEDIVDKMMRKEINIKDRLKPEAIDQYLNMELHGHGIPLSFEYAVIDMKNNIVYHSKQFQEAPESMKFEARLFPDDVISKPNYLVVYFPEKKITSIIQWDLWDLLRSSLFLSSVSVLP